MSPVIQQIPSDLARPIKDLKLGNAELLKVSKEILAIDQELLTKSNKQIEEQQKANTELAKLNTEVAKLDPPPILFIYNAQFFIFHTTTEGTILGPYNLEKYSILSGYLQNPSTGVIVRVEWRSGEYPAGGFLGQDEFALYPGRGEFSQFNLPVRGPYLRMKFQGIAEGNASLTLQATNFKGLPKFQASMMPLINAEASLAAGANTVFNILDIVSGPINYTLTGLSGGNCAFTTYNNLPVYPTIPGYPSNQVNLTVTNSYTTQGVINIPPLPMQMVVYNQGASTQTVQVVLWQQQ